jgi:hypothetical protein
MRMASSVIFTRLSINREQSLLVVWVSFLSFQCIFKEVTEVGSRLKCCRNVFENFSSFYLINDQTMDGVDVDDFLETNEVGF